MRKFSFQYAWTLLLPAALMAFASTRSWAQTDDSTPPSKAPYHSQVPQAAARLERDLKETAAQKTPPRHWYYNYRDSMKYCLTDAEALRQSLPKVDETQPCTLDSH